MSVCVSTGSRLSGDAALAVIQEGGNAVDAAIAATVSLMCTEIGIMGPGAGGFISIFPTHGAPLVLDANVAAPGKARSAQKPLQGPSDVYMSYGGGLSTRVGYDSIAVPGILKGLVQASDQFGSSRLGRKRFERCCLPTQEACQSGFPITEITSLYMKVAQEVIYGWHPDSLSTLGSTLLETGSELAIPALAATLEEIAETKGESLYGGPLGERITNEIEGCGGSLTFEDLRSYEVKTRQPQMLRCGEWNLAFPPLPSVGGASLMALLLLSKEKQAGGPLDPEELTRLQIACQREVFGFREEHFSQGDLGVAVSGLLEHAGYYGHLQGKSSSTIHVSAMDDDGLCCAITASAGYGSGVMPAGTGFYMNNAMGELELVNSLSLDPGDRLPSNMTPLVGEHTNRKQRIALGSPGASRITSALYSTLLHFLHSGKSLREAVEAPRLHVESPVREKRVSYEADLVGVPEGLEKIEYQPGAMYFGGVNAVQRLASGNLEGVADPRRHGATIHQ